MTFHNVIILIKSVISEYKINYYNIFLEKGFHEDKSNTEYFQMNVCILQMLYFERIDVSEGTDIHKRSISRECDICHY